jgi:hypothetical protein
VAYHLLLGGTFLLIGLILLAVLGDTRQRRKTRPAGAGGAPSFQSGP